ncbi:head-tail connector protein [Dickeya phage Sucellus]|nr:head-tail connector protein [Dickeya phage Sucellus]
MLEYEFDDYFNSLDRIKEQLRVDVDFTDDDLEIKLKSEISLDLISKYISRDIYPKKYLIPDGDEVSTYLTKNIMGAFLLMVTDLYINRTVFDDVNKYENRTFKMMLDGIRYIGVSMT